MLEDQSWAEPELQQRTQLGLEQVETHQENHTGMGREDEVAESVVEDVDIVFEKRSKRKKGRQWEYLEDVLKFKPQNIVDISNYYQYPEDLKSNKIAAAFLELPYKIDSLKNYCNSDSATILRTRRFGGLGFVFQRGSPMARDFSEAILKLWEDGTLMSLEDEWLTPPDEASEGNLTPGEESAWKKTVRLVRYFYIKNPGRAPTLADTSDTAEMPDFYANGEYDLSGFSVGIVKKDSVIDGRDIVAGDVLIGLPSSGVHSNGFSLVSKDKLPGEDVTLGEALMAPTVIYVKQVLEIISKGGIKGIAHIKGGGFTDNIPRVFPKGLGAVIHSNSWEVPTVFKWIQEAGNIEDAEMRRTFNMGIGMVLVVSKETSSRILESGNGAYKAYRIGEVLSDEGVTYH
uniref:phosphoribosylformylglycinamidine cyclo-ligase n=1 Tax=Fagus sylvatica TaxID=28930 RepID=A0A2N9G5T7_FAGSY